MSKKKYSVYPLEDTTLFDMYKKHRSNFWTESEIDFSGDNFESLNKPQREMVKKLLFFFANADRIVSDNISNNLLGNELPIEADLYLGYQIMAEHIHMITYADMIEAYITDIKEKENAYDAIFQSDFVAKKLQWANKYASSSNSFSESLVAAIAIESIYFSSTFAAIFWLKELGLPLTGLYKANETILKDEIMHYEFNTYLFKNYIDKSSINPMPILLDAVDIEKTFIDDFIGDGVDGINKEELKKYVECICDIVLEQMGLEKYFNSTHNLRFMDGLGIQKTVNFFETRSVNYTKLEGSVGIDLDNDF